ncbi:GNAT family N-acetyltransferase, partial [Escherichia coli]|nr:GNAT family N-acetyltransferase [Escherichia coli]
SARNNFGLLMFYCSAFMKHFVYYSENNNAVAIAMQNDHALLCFDIFCDSESSLTKIVNELAAQHTRQVILGFTPTEDRVGEYEKIEIDDFLFIYTAKENIFKERKLMFPTLSHA